MTKICVLGLGYIGLPTASMFASRGHEVVGVDVNPRVVDSINAARAHFSEPDLDMLMTAAVNTGRLRAQGVPETADVFIIAVPTPFREGHKPDLSYVDAATDAIAPFVRDGDLVILESTSPVGTTERMCARLKAARPDLAYPRYKDEGRPGELHLAHCPERILPGQMVRELVSNDRIVGGMSEACAEAAREVYEAFVQGDIVLTDCRTAEFVKLIENSFRDVNIAFANELSMVCDRLDIDVWRAIALANRHPRVSILKPGPGVGGHCIAVDPWFIVDTAPEESRLIRLAREVNTGKTSHVADRILALAGRFRDPVVACFGLAYKNDVEDLRESPAIEIVERLLGSEGLRVLVCEPMIDELPAHLAADPRVTLTDADTARQGADIVAFLVAHKRFARLDPKTFLNKVVVDAIGLMSGA